MIQCKIKELKEINKLIDLRNSSDISIESHKEKRDQLISELEEELMKLNDFDNWKEWKNFQFFDF
jgi:DNA-binding transcriptional MerR regulator